MSNSKSLRSIVTLSIALVALLGYGFISAWSVPPAGTVPPDNNVPAPINVGSINQTKSGDLAVQTMSADYVVSWNQNRSGQFCNLDGTICATVEELLADKKGGGGETWLVNDQHTEGGCTGLGGSVVWDDEGNPFCRLSDNSCPTGWEQYKQWATYADGSTRRIAKCTDTSAPNPDPEVGTYGPAYQCGIPGTPQAWSDNFVGPKSMVACIYVPRGLYGEKQISQSYENCYPRQTEIGCY